MGFFTMRVGQRSCCSATMTEPSRKKKHKSTTSSKEIEDDNVVILNTVWKHYCNYFFNEADEEEDYDIDDDDYGNAVQAGETDELVEILHLLNRNLPQVFQEVWEFPSNTNANTNTKNNNNHQNDTAKTTTTTTTTTAATTATTSIQQQDAWNRRQLVPLLHSVTSTLLADASIAEYMQMEQREVALDGTNTTELIQQTKQKNDVLNNVRTHLFHALQTYPHNAAALQMTTNYIRMTQHQHQTTATTTPTNNNLKVTLAQMYTHAANVASQVRTASIQCMNDSSIPEAVKEWIVALLLNQVCGVDELDNDDVDDDEDEDDEQIKLDTVKEDDDEPTVVWSASTVEGMSRYMAAMMYSMVQQHDLALEQLQCLNITHRIHPNVWNHAMVISQEKPNSTSSTSTTEESIPIETSKCPIRPLSFRGGINNGVLPKHLYEQLCRVFQPKAEYWSESSYANRGYFSFYMDVPQAKESSTSTLVKTTARNAIDDAICNYLLPLIQTQTEYNSNDIIGYEWWVHTRAMSANLGHNLHFDTDETSLQRDGTISHPIISSVLYLTGGDSATNNSSPGGSTIIFNQNPNATSNADRAWYSQPKDNSFMIFPGDLLHGVLPCSGTTTDKDHDTLTSREPVIATAMNEPISDLFVRYLSDKAKLETDEGNVADNTSPNRLTLMIGFWTRNVPNDMDPKLTVEDRLYGPCSPLPSIEETKWVQALCAGYGLDPFAKDTTTDVMTPIPTNPIVTVPLPCVSPAWEEISSVPNANSIQALANDTAAFRELTIPRDIDHRFFVQHAPHCFKSQLMEAQYCIDALDYGDDDDDDEENDYDGEE
jgi:hypothetical protein